MTSDRPFESKLNVVLSVILSERLNIQSISEKRQGKNQPDILIFSGGIKIIVEASYSKQDAENDVSKKVENGFANIGIALFYLEKIHDIDDTQIKSKLEKSKFKVKLFIPHDIRNTLDHYIEGKKLISKAQTGWFETNVIDLASLLRNNLYEVLLKEERNSTPRY